METYIVSLLAVQIAALIGIILLLVRRERAHKSEIERLFDSLANQLQAARNIQANVREETDTLVSAHDQLRSAFEAAGSREIEGLQGVSSAISTQIGLAVSKIETGIKQHQSALDATLIRASKQYSESASAHSSELVSEIRKTTKAVEALKASLEESLQFESKL